MREFHVTQRVDRPDGTLELECRGSGCCWGTRCDSGNLHNRQFRLGVASGAVSSARLKLP